MNKKQLSFLNFSAALTTFHLLSPPSQPYSSHQMIAGHPTRLIIYQEPDAHSHWSSLDLT